MTGECDSRQTSKLESEDESQELTSGTAESKQKNQS